MTDPLTLLEHLNRPRLLVQAARHARSEYNRSRHLRRIFAADGVPGPAEAALKLMEVEAGLERARRERDASYSAARHIVALAALMHEADILKARRSDAQAKASATSPLRLAM
jgi:plasmid stability protein